MFDEIWKKEGCTRLVVWGKALICMALQVCLESLPGALRVVELLVVGRLASKVRRTGSLDASGVALLEAPLIVCASARTNVISHSDELM